MNDVDYETLDPGIRDWVRLCRQHGFDTTDSGDGYSKPSDARAFGDQPHIVAVCAVEQLRADARRLQLLLGPAWRVEAIFFPTEETAILLALPGGCDPNGCVDPARQASCGTPMPLHHPRAGKTPR